MNKAAKSKGSSGGKKGKKGSGVGKAKRAAREILT